MPRRGRTFASKQVSEREGEMDRTDDLSQVRCALLKTEERGEGRERDREGGEDEEDSSSVWVETEAKEGELEPGRRGRDRFDLSTILWWSWTEQKVTLSGPILDRSGGKMMCSSWSLYASIAESTSLLISPAAGEETQSLRRARFSISSGSVRSS